MVSEKLTLWQKNKTLLRIITVEKGKGHQVHVGNVLYADEQSGSFLFYDLDQKKNYNFSMNEIEDIQPYEKPPTNAPAKQLQKQFNKSAPKIEEFKEDVRDEAIALIKSLPSSKLYALIPLLQLLKNSDAKK
ncbi:hypothetical protein [Desulfuribacillus alkaliarsenatis]|uniref:Uncharacterized protein n=1 Tax=Desulfuribacillus alkaliarsenatis TaxID=766136 RepID=A0A1E5FYF0_9FIRM|nr:hypothetical protein [Desulfuribacillus alkaliarsenatis]OEF95568.1 hypothetical protein BHF68_11975 [Desulfuribacillus alkaliarsenatis]